MIKKLKSIFGKFSRIGVMTMAVMAVSATAAFAAEGDPITGISASAVTGAVSGAVTDTVALMTALLPYALTVFAAIWGVKKAIRFFKGAAN